MTENKQPYVFINHASEDKILARKLFEHLITDGIDAWLDDENLLPGQDWEFEIKKAIENADAIIVCLSSNSLVKEGFVQKELKLALDVADQKPEGTIHIIPARLDECDIPTSLRKYQWANLFDDAGYERIKRALKTRFDLLPEMKKNTPSKETHIATSKLAQVTIIVEKDILHFTDKEKEGFVFAISKLTGISSNQIRVVQVTEGSVVITLELPEVGAKRLMELYYKNDTEIEKLCISKITLKVDSDENKVLSINEGKLNILFLTADPTDASRLRLGQEAREIREKLQLSKNRDKFEFNERWSVRPVDISQAMLDLQPQIVHFSGHGMSSGEICFENLTGQMQPVTPSALSTLFGNFHQTKVVILNACYSDMQAKAIAEKVDYVIGMTKGITDAAAIAFSVGFYQAIGAGRNVTDAYELGVAQIKLQGIEEHEIPVLLKVETSKHNPNNKLSFPEYTSFQQDLESLIRYADDNFVGIREETPTTDPDGFINYKSKFSFEYSTGNTVWYHNEKWYFTCYFCKDATLQQAKTVFEERLQEIKSKLASEWKFEEKENLNSLHRKEFEAIRKYNTLRIRMLVVAYNSGNRSQVDFTLEQL